MAGTYISDLGNLLYAGLDAVFNSALKSPRQTYYKNIVHQKSVGMVLFLQKMSRQKRLA